MVIGAEAYGLTLKLRNHGLRAWKLGLKWIRMVRALAHDTLPHHLSQGLRHGLIHQRAFLCKVASWTLSLSETTRDFAMSNLDRLLTPKSVALIGGSWCKNVQFQLERLGFDGPVYHVNPKGAFPSVEALPVAPDAAFIAVNRHASVQVAGQLSALGAGGAICFASGFEEAGAEGADLQDALLKAAGDMPILGPNCYGVVNYLDGAALWPDVHGGQRVESGVALITQSSNILINMSMQARGLPMAYLIAAGNGAQIGLPQLIAQMDADPRVTAIGLHIEGFGDAAAFHAAARACAKPILAIKAGETEAAQALTVSHTASLSGSDEVASAFLERCGIGRVRSLEGLLEGLKVLNMGGPLPAKTLASVSCSGGEASLMADFGARFGFTFPSLEGLGIGETLNPLVHVSNPFDYHTFDWGDGDALTPAFTKVLRGPQAITVFVLDFPKPGTGDASGFETAIDSMAAAAQAFGRRAAILASYPENMPQALAESIAAKGLIPLNGLQAGMEGLLAAVLPSGGKYQHVATPTRTARQLDEAQAKADLKAQGLDIPKGEVLTAAPTHAPKGPLVMKAMSTDLAHKSEVGGVLLNVTHPAEAYAQLSALSPTVLMEEMVQDAVAELIVGLAPDPVIGGHIVVGAGGVLTEVLKDSAILLLPFTQAQAENALDSLKIAKLLTGYRGKPAASRPALISALMAVQARALKGDIIELDINPLMVTPERAIVADALLVLGEEI